MQYCEFSAQLYAEFANDILLSEFDGYPQVFLAIIGEESTVPTMLLQLLQICRFHNPDEKIREEYFEQKMRNPPLGITGIDAKQLAKKTEGFSFVQLKNLLYFLRLNQRQLLMARETVSEWEKYSDDTSLLQRYSVPAESAEELIILLQKSVGAFTSDASRIIIQASSEKIPTSATSTAQGTEDEDFRRELDKLPYRELKTVLRESANHSKEPEGVE